MRKITDNILFVIEILILVAVLLFISQHPVFAANVTDNNRGSDGYILVNNGTGQGHQGTWTKPEDLPAIVNLDKALNNEIDNRLSGDKDLKASLDSEIYKRAEADDGLLSDISTVNDDLRTEVDDRLLGDKELNVNIDKVDSNSRGRDTVLQNNIDTESNTRSSADSVLQSNLSNVDINSQGRDTKLQNNINSVNSRVDDVSNRVSALEKTQYVVRTELKFIREKHLEVGVYTEYNTGRNVCSEVGLNIVIPIGTSYQDRENKKIINRLDRLEKTVGQSTVIERTVDTKGKLKSISISNGILMSNGKF